MTKVSRAIDYLRHLEATGRGDEVVHVVLVEEEQRKRVENTGDKPMTRFCFDTGSAETYSGLHAEKDRIIELVKNRGLAGKLMLRAWREVGQPQVDKWLAEEEATDVAGEQPSQTDQSAADRPETPPEVPANAQGTPQEPTDEKQAPKTEQRAAGHQISNVQHLKLWSVAYKCLVHKSMDEIESYVQQMARDAGFTSTKSLTEDAYAQIVAKLESEFKAG